MTGGDRAFVLAVAFMVVVWLTPDQQTGQRVLAFVLCLLALGLCVVEAWVHRRMRRDDDPGPDPDSWEAVPKPEPPPETRKDPRYRPDWSDNGT